jgi:hypothetical protein
MANTEHRSPELNRKFIEWAIESFAPWRLGNDVLYKLCDDHQNHDSDDAIIAKFWLIGRSYAAAVERRRKGRDDEEANFVGDDFYTKKVVPCVRRSKIDSWFEELRADREDIPATTVKVHKKLTSLLYEITKLEKRSLASKYLHFHFKHKFFIYDTRAKDGLHRIMREIGGSCTNTPYNEFDREYAEFFNGCKFVRDMVQERLNRQITPRELDSVLVTWSDLSRKKGSTPAGGLGK